MVAGAKAISNEEEAGVAGVGGDLGEEVFNIEDERDPGEGHSSVINFGYERVELIGLEEGVLVEARVSEHEVEANGGKAKEAAEDGASVIANRAAADTILFDEGVQ